VWPGKGWAAMAISGQHSKWSALEVPSSSTWGSGSMKRSLRRRAHEEPCPEQGRLALRTSAHENCGVRCVVRAMSRGLWLHEEVLSEPLGAASVERWWLELCYIGCQDKMLWARWLNQDHGCGF
jgi:hypothetical protein